jgi:hypothetical protein
VTEQTRDELERPALAPDRRRIAARMEANDRRTFYFVVKSLIDADLEWIVQRAAQRLSEDGPLPWHLSSFRAARSELRRRQRVAA